jgi:PDZ domain-containing protein
MVQRHLKNSSQSRKKPMRFSRTPLLVRLLFFFVIALPLVTPVNFVVIQPGEAAPLFPKILKINKEYQQRIATYKPDGQMYLLSIWVSNPDAKVLGAEIVQCWVRSDCAVIPRSAVYEKGTDTKTEVKKATAQMKESQNTAIVAAKSLLAKNFPEVETSELGTGALNVSLKNTGGPSGGLIFALGLTELLTPEDLLQGRKVAASGTVSNSGKVGPIGGIAEKVIAAKEAGAELLFMSRDNCEDLPTDVSGISVIAVATLQDALNHLRKPLDSSSAGVIGCTNLSA